MPSQLDHASLSSLIDSQATVIASQPQLTSPGDRKRSAAALHPRVICRRCRMNPRSATKASEDLIGRHSSWGNVSPFYFDLDAAPAAISSTPTLQNMPPELALSAGHVPRNRGRPQVKSASRVMTCALEQSMHNSCVSTRQGGSRPSFKSFLLRRLTFAAWCALTQGDWASAEALARALQPARAAIADVLWKTGLEVLRRNAAKDSQRRRFAQMCIGFTKGPLNSAVLNQHVVDTLLYSAHPDSALAELRRFTVGSTISSSPVLHYAIASAALAAMLLDDDQEGYEFFRLMELQRTAVDAATRLLEVAPAAAQSHVTMWRILNACGRAPEAAAVVEAALVETSPLHMHPSLLHIAINDPAVSSNVALSSAIYLLELDPCHPAPAAYVAQAAADGRLTLPAAAEALAASLDTTTPLDAGTWEIVCQCLGLLMWGWNEEALREWLGWRLQWWPRLHLTDVQRQISAAVSSEAQRIVACKALLALLLQRPSSSFHNEFVRSCSGWAAAAWLRQAELKCREMQLAMSTAQELPVVSFSSSSEGGSAQQQRHFSSSAAATESPSTEASSPQSASVQ